MKTTITQFLQSAKEKNHNLTSLIELTKKFENFNPEIELKPLPNLGFIDDLEQLPAVDILDTEAVITLAKLRNGEVLPGRIPGKQL